MKLLVTGATGQVGWELSRSLMPLGEVIAVNRASCDFSRPQTVATLIDDLQPDVIVNAAAYTAVDKAEQEEALATMINATAVGIMAKAAGKAGALLVHYSTDYVFDGRKTTPYAEDDAPNPLNTYGRSKLAGEIAIREVGCDHLILRTSWVYAARGRNFLNTVLRLARERDELNIVDDQYGAPTSARFIADTTAHIIRQAQRERVKAVFAPGTFHLAAAGATSWHGFASAIVTLAAQQGLLDASRATKVNPIATNAYPLPAVRPVNSRLDCQKLRSRFGVAQSDWQQLLEKVIPDIALG